MTTVESPLSKRTRKSIIWVVFIFLVTLGVPMFLYTTQIHRAELPVEAVQIRAATFRTTAQMRVPVFLDIPNSHEFFVEAAQEILDRTVSERYGLSEVWGIQLNRVAGRIIDPLVDYVVRIEYIKDPVDDDAEKPIEAYKISPHSKDITMFITEGAVSAKKVDEFLSIILLNVVFKDELEAIAGLFNNSKDTMQPDIVFPYSSTYNVVFNLFVENGKMVNWEIEHAVKSLEPVFEALKHIASFKISTQTQYYTKLHKSPSYDNDRRANIIAANDLSTFINYGDWNLITHDIYPSINFLVYFPEGNYKKTPLLVEDSQTNSFLVPQWGGVYIYNSPMPILQGATAKLSKSDLAPICEIFTSQLFELLGVPKNPKSPRIRIDSLHRIMTLKNLKRSLDNLTSLIKLSDSLSEISIPESTNSHVVDALRYYDESVNSLKNESDFSNSVEFSARSVESSDKAFFEKEMVQQAYFPSEHKLAVFLPLLGPLSSIVILGLLRSLKQDKKEQLKEKKDI